jgi:hypothetical protein
MTHGRRPVVSSDDDLGDRIERMKEANRKRRANTHKATYDEFIEDEILHPFVHRHDPTNDPSAMPLYHARQHMLDVVEVLASALQIRVWVLDRHQDDYDNDWEPDHDIEPWVGVEVHTTLCGAVDRAVDILCQRLIGWHGKGNLIEYLKDDMSIDFLYPKNHRDATGEFDFFACAPDGKRMKWNLRCCYLLAGDRS